MAAGLRRQAALPSRVGFDVSVCEGEAPPNSSVSDWPMPSQEEDVLNVDWVFP